MSIKENMVVTLHYKGTFEDGKIFDDSNSRGQPLIFLMGAKNVIVGLEKGIIGLKKGDEKKLIITPDEGYGDYNKQMIQKIPIGSQLLIQNPNNGQITPATIMGKMGDSIEMDFNHPLSGKKLLFDVKIIDLREATEEELKNKQ